MGEVDRKRHDGFTSATCRRCGMYWQESDEPVELLPGMWTGSGEREHECPEPFSRETAEAMVALASAASPLIVSQKMKARIRLGLAAPSSEGQESE